MRLGDPLASPVLLFAATLQIKARRRESNSPLETGPPQIDLDVEVDTAHQFLTLLVEIAYADLAGELPFREPIRGSARAERQGEGVQNVPYYPESFKSRRPEICCFDCWHRTRAGHIVARRPAQRWLRLSDHHRERDVHRLYGDSD